MNATGRRGFTLVELIIVVSIIGLLSAIAIPNFVRMQRNARIGRTAAEMRNLSVGFVGYKVAYGQYPPDSHEALPPGMEEFIKPSIWTDGAPVGGNYNWEGPDGYPYAGISIFPPDAFPADEQKALDGMLDNGDLGNGKFRIGTNGRPTYIIEE